MKNSEFYEKISSWLETYHQTNDEQKKFQIKTLIVSQMIPVVKHIAKTIARRSTDPIEDMVQAGSIGLLKAIDRYSKDKNDNFRVYAGYLIIGEMKHFLRDKLSMIRVPAHIQELAIRINNFTQSLTNEELYDLTSEDLAMALDIPTKAVDYALQMNRRRSTVSLEEVFTATENSLSFEEMISDDDYREQAEYADIKIIFNEIIEKLNPEDRVLLDMYYNQDMSQKEIAEGLQLSQMAVSRKMKQVFNNVCDLIVESHPDIEIGDF